MVNGVTRIEPYLMLLDLVLLGRVLLKIGPPRVGVRIRTSEETQIGYRNEDARDETAESSAHWRRPRRTW